MSELLTSSSGSGGILTESPFSAMVHTVKKEFPPVPFKEYFKDNNHLGTTGPVLNSPESSRALNPLDPSELMLVTTNIGRNGNRTYLNVTINITDVTTFTTKSVDSYWFYPSESHPASPESEIGKMRVTPIFGDTKIHFVIARTMGGNRYGQGRIFAIEQLDYDYATNTFDTSSAGNTASAVSTYYPRGFLVTIDGAGGDYTIPDNSTLSSNSTSDNSIHNRAWFNPDKGGLTLTFAVNNYSKIFTVDWNHETKTGTVTGDYTTDKLYSTNSTGAVTEKGLLVHLYASQALIISSLKTGETYQGGDQLQGLTGNIDYFAKTDIGISVYLNKDGQPTEPLMSGTSAKNAAFPARALTRLLELIDDYYFPQ